MDFDSIMTSITSRLTENFGNEIPYLKEQIKNIEIILMQRKLLAHVEG